MITMDEIRNHVENNGYTLHNRGEIVTMLPDGKNYITGNIFVSEGINYVLSDDTWKDYIHKALEQVQNKDYGGFYERDETPSVDDKWYQCKSPLSPDGNDTHNCIICRQKNGHLAMFFMFER